MKFGMRLELDGMSVALFKLCSAVEYFIAVDPFMDPEDRYCWHHRQNSLLQSKSFLLIFSLRKDTVITFEYYSDDLGYIDSQPYTSMVSVIVSIVSYGCFHQSVRLMLKELLICCGG